MKNKLPILALAIGLGFIGACCDCPSEDPYFDYSSLKSTVFINYGENKLRIAINPDSLTYEGKDESDSKFQFCFEVANENCPGRGYMGARYSLDSISIQADRDFAAAFPAGTSLNPYFKVTTTYFSSSSTTYEPLDSTRVFDLNKLPELKVYEFDDNLPLSIFLVKQPDSMPTEGFSFTITCHKSDGSVVEHVLAPIRW